MYSVTWYTEHFANEEGMQFSNSLIAILVTCYMAVETAGNNKIPLYSLTCLVIFYLFIFMHLFNYLCILSRQMSICWIYIVIVYCMNTEAVFPFCFSFNVIPRCFAGFNQDTILILNSLVRNYYFVCTILSVHYFIIFNSKWSNYMITLFICSVLRLYNNKNVMQTNTPLAASLQIAISCLEVTFFCMRLY